MSCGPTSAFTASITPASDHRPAMAARTSCSRCARFAPIVFVARAAPARACRAKEGPMARRTMYFVAASSSLWSSPAASVGDAWCMSLCIWALLCEYSSGMPSRWPYSCAAVFTASFGSPVS